jgi:hypothetical protein
MKLSLSILTALIVCAGCQLARRPDLAIQEPDKRQLCRSFLASHRSTLESMFEKELYATAYGTDEWHQALNELEVATRGAGGHAPDPRTVMQSALDKLTKVRDGADRLRLEYLLLGGQISLEERRQFDGYCVAVENN